jgi:hypothetical protein
MFELGGRQSTAYRQAGPGRLPLALRASEGLGRTVEASDHLVLGEQHTTGVLLLKATRGVTIAVVSFRERKRR